MTSRITIVATLAVAAFCILQTPALSQHGPSQESASPTNLTPDREFAKRAAGGGLAEVKLGRLAEDQGESEAVKNFAKRMILDHRKANEQLKRTAAREKIELPTEMNAHDQDIYNRLSQLSGPEFDRAYAREMVNGHKQVIADFRSESDNGQDQAIKDFAFRTLPALQDHMKLARQMLHDVEPGNSKQNGNK